MTETPPATSQQPTPERAALILGGSGGIGTAVAHSLARDGYAIGLVGRNREKLDATAASIAENGARVTVHTADVTEEEAVAAVVKEAHEELGRIDVLVHAAGIAEPGFVGRAPVEHWEHVLRTNLLSSVFASKAVLPILRKQKGGHIILIGSWASEEGRAGLAAYSASKGALASFTRGLLREVGRRGVKVTTISPEEVATPMHGDEAPEAEQMIRPEDVAETVSFALRLSPQASIPELFLRRTSAIV